MINRKDKTISSLILVLLLVYQASFGSSFVICIEDDICIAPIHEPHCVVEDEDHGEHHHHENDHDHSNEENHESPIVSTYNDCIPCEDIELNFKADLDNYNFKHKAISILSCHVCTFLKKEINKSHQIDTQIGFTTGNNLFFPETIILIV